VASPPFQGELIAKKIRGLEGRLAPALSQCVPSAWISTSMTLRKGGGKPPFPTSNLLLNLLDFMNGPKPWPLNSDP